MPTSPGNRHFLHQTALKGPKICSPYQCTARKFLGLLPCLLLKISVPRLHSYYLTVCFFCSLPLICPIFKERGDYKNGNTPGVHFKMKFTIGNRHFLHQTTLKGPKICSPYPKYDSQISRPFSYRNCTYFGYFSFFKIPQKVLSCVQLTLSRLKNLSSQ
ncbi:MAG: hypothetical protein ACI92I_000118 [Acidimicrobiales bacterium]